VTRSRVSSPFAFGATVVLITILLIWNLWGTSAPSRHKFGLGFSVGHQLGSERERFWGPAVRLWNGDDVDYGAGNLRPPGRGCGDFPGRAGATRPVFGLHFSGGMLAAVPSVIYGMLAIFTVVPLMREYIEPALKGAFGYLPQFQGPMLGVAT